ncbi:MAG: PEP-CTERM sorting domain-containing protein [Okeania sp. SIO2F4]|uniref:PEP-CTERM sorting domain-containing protein n=1 Tax=Okeania sp. SIO2F4 TaxID=2607790 RepID=UPI00142BD82B|nr:PEP-CTERM sorting domain-containing protein [Okeania sp. SIO2F4]NES02180.1 PEP-CTERM sorting domain-containing protein [Okeania sp. SIO2F4]
MVPYGIGSYYDGRDFRFWSDGWGRLDWDWHLDNSSSRTYYNETIATFDVVDPPPPPDVSDRVPEPSLILGLIGLGGLMLGDKRKTRG